MEGMAGIGMSSLPSHIVPCVFGLMAGALTNSMLHRGTFSVYDTAVRAILVGAVAGIVTLFGALFSQKRNSKP